MFGDIGGRNPGKATKAIRKTAATTGVIHRLILWESMLLFGASTVSFGPDSVCCTATGPPTSDRPSAGTVPDRTSRSASRRDRSRDHEAVQPLMRTLGQLSRPLLRPGPLSTRCVLEHSCPQRRPSYCQRAPPTEGSLRRDVCGLFDKRARGRMSTSSLGAQCGTFQVRALVLGRLRDTT